MLFFVQLLIWGGASLILGLWSLLTWALQSFFTLGSSQAVETTIRAWLTPFVFMENWVPVIMSVVKSSSEFLATMGSWVPTVIWLVWSVGAVIVLVPTIVASLMAVWGIRKMRQIETAQASGI